jgi:antirestriction protein
MSDNTLHHTTTPQQVQEWPGALPERGIYAACLASYNAGRLVGRWIDCEGLTGAEIMEEIAEMLEQSPVPDAEEWAIHDYAGIPSSFGEYPDLDKIAEWVEMVEEHGEAWEVYVDWYGAEYATPEHFTECYRGEYKSPEDFAYDLHKEMGDLASVPESLRYHIDWKSVARDMQLGGDVYFAEVGYDQTFVFWTH